MHTYHIPMVYYFFEHARILLRMNPHYKESGLNIIIIKCA